MRTGSENPDGRAAVDADPLRNRAGAGAFRVKFATSWSDPLTCRSLPRVTSRLGDGATQWCHVAAVFRPEGGAACARS